MWPTMLPPRSTGRANFAVCVVAWAQGPGTAGCSRRADRIAEAERFGEGATPDAHCSDQELRAKDHDHRATLAISGAFPDDR